MAYQAPLADLTFLANELIDFEAITQGEMSAELALAIWQEASKFAQGVLAPLNRVGDQQGLDYQDGCVKTPEGFKQAWQQMCQGGWNSVNLPEAYGGQGLPWVISTPVTEMFSSANKAFNMCPGLTSGAVEAIMHSATDELKDSYLTKMVSGQWTGTMNLTEPQAGSDLAAIRTKAIPTEEGHYLIKGQKIFISFGEHDLTENIIHLVLARLPDAPSGVAGISLFLVPKFLLDEEGNPEGRNDLVCTGLEHKLGIHASPTASISFGEKEGAIGYLVGEEHRGLAAMFVMMNMARLSVGVEGVASAEAAYQLARSYAFERIQGVEENNPSQPATLSTHADVQRMLLVMQAKTRAMRAMALVIAEAQDLLESTQDSAVRQRQQSFIELMTPVFKAWATESGIDIASLGIQVFGGMGYVEETGAAQIWRDARISSIYEGTTGIQANDLLVRKLVRDQGAALFALTEQMQASVEALQRAGQGYMSQRLETAINSLKRSVQSILVCHEQQLRSARFVSVPLLMLMGNVIGGWLLSRCAVAALEGQNSSDCSDEQRQSWLQSCDFYSRYVLSEVAGFELQISHFLSGGSAALPNIQLLNA